MINRQHAEEIAAKYLRNLEDQIGKPLQLIKKTDFPWGWVFYYNSKVYLETGTLSSRLVGNAPFIVDIEDGLVHVLGTAYPVETYIREYEISRSARKKAKNGLKGT
jgi:hypothetical protein